MSLLHTQYSTLHLWNLTTARHLYITAHLLPTRCSWSGGAAAPFLSFHSISQAGLRHKHPSRNSDTSSACKRHPGTTTHSSSRSPLISKNKLRAPLSICAYTSRRRTCSLDTNHLPLLLSCRSFDQTLCSSIWLSHLKRVLCNHSLQRNPTLLACILPCFALAILQYLHACGSAKPDTCMH